MTAPVPSDVESYLARVRAALADLPADERDDLLAEVEASLHETTSETEGSVAARLGPPEEFAAELRSAAGLQAPAAERPAGLRSSAALVAADPRVVAARALLRELAPIWWAVRGYIAVAALALLFHADWSTSHGAVPRIGNAKLGVAAIVIAAAASIALGFWSRRAPHSLRMPLAGASLLLVVAAIPVAQHLLKRTSPRVAVETVTIPLVVPGLAYDGVPVDNIYPYSRSGRLLHDVLLYTGSGTALDVKTVAYDPHRRIVRTRTGRPVFNAFPIRYYEPGTKVVLHPNAQPPLKLPRVATPPLVEKRR